MPPCSPVPGSMSLQRPPESCVWAGAELGPPLLGLVVPCCAIHSSPATSLQPHQGTITSTHIAS